MKRTSVTGLVLGLLVVAVSGMAQTPVLWTANGHYYEVRYFPSGITWNDARIYAETLTYNSLNGHLATITSAEENAFIFDTFRDSYPNSLFLGGFQPRGSVEPAGNWQWITGETWFYTNWSPNEPNNTFSGGAIFAPPGTVAEEVLLIYIGIGVWNDVPLLSGWGGLLVEYDEYDTISDPFPPPAPVLWTTNGHYYDAKPFPSGITWDNAKTYAETLSYQGAIGHLATITSAEENAFIVNNFGASAINGFFLGGFQPDGSPEPGGNWQWITGEPWSYTNWHSTAPNNEYSGGAIINPPGDWWLIPEDVLHFWAHNGTWNDVPHDSGWGGLIVEYEIMHVTIDIKPGDSINNINLKGMKTIPVAIISTADFYAPQDVDVTTLTFGAFGDENSYKSYARNSKDVNGDGIKDFVCNFTTELTGLLCGHTKGILRGKTMTGKSFEGSDIVLITPCK